MVARLVSRTVEDAKPEDKTTLKEAEPLSPEQALFQVRAASLASLLRQIGKQGDRIQGDCT